MKIENLITKIFILIYILLITVSVNAQDVEKVMFVKSIPVKIQSKKVYSFMVGYIANKDRDINFELTNKEFSYFVNKKINVKKGQGVISVKFSPINHPKAGVGYRLLLSLREKNGDWKTTKAASVINNIEFVTKVVRVSDNVSFSPLTPYSLDNSDTFNFDIDYSIGTENLIQVSIWNGNNWQASSKKVAIQPGSGSQKVEIKTTSLMEEGIDYRFMLTFGTRDEFNSKKTKSKEISGIHIKKPAKKLTIKEINAKSIQLVVNKESENLTLTGKIAYKFIKIIDRNGQVLLEALNTNSIKISSLTKGAYFAITSENNYYKFVKF
ncbi:hypothetical protein MPF19_04110 [Polaribacter sp. Z014]|uniref:hypothetical protein n=1 Tax=Polaribacter sp. Z014 TaxID=2927126 RepID=UPI00202272AE|nr:hypothetical protein [Polaribacter sp. Z014]MCL7762587.1 hypothetical protein [Polaribacter sp. Z014]